MNGSHTLFAIAVVVLGAALGLGTYTFAYARGWAYMTDDPRACANCYVMNEQYDGWIKSSHRSVAVCNDCHVPHSLIAKYTTKARNGFWHSFYFTTGRFPDPLRITEGNRRVTEGACRHCHTEIAEAIDHGRETPCIRCHRYVGHWVR